jgi:hypothetical protein
MVSMERLTSRPITAALPPAPAIALEDDFEARWAAWVAQGRIHERRASRTLAIQASVVTAAAVAAMFYVVLRS